MERERDREGVRLGGKRACALGLGRGEGQKFNVSTSKLSILKFPEPPKSQYWNSSRTVKNAMFDPPKSQYWIPRISQKLNIEIPGEAQKFNFRIPKNSILSFPGGTNNSILSLPGKVQTSMFESPKIQYWDFGAPGRGRKCNFWTTKNSILRFRGHLKHSILKMEKPSNLQSN